VLVFRQVAPIGAGGEQIMSVRGIRLASGLVVIGLGVCAAVATAEGPPDLLWLGGGHIGVNAVAVSPDGGTLATASATDNTVKLWQVANGHLVRTINAAYAAVNAVAWSPDGTHLASGGNWVPGLGDATLKLWSPASGSLVLAANPSASYDIVSLAYSPTGNRIAAGCSDSNVRIFDATTGAVVHTLTGHTWSVFTVAWSPDGQFVASGSGDRQVKIWNPVSGGAALRTLVGHTSFVMSLAFLPDGRLASTGWDHTIRLWNPATGASLGTFTGPAGSSVEALATDPAGGRLAAGGSEAAEPNVIRLWSDTGSILGTLTPGHKGSVFSLDFLPDSTLISGGADSVARHWDPTEESLIRQFGINRGAVPAVAFSPDARVLAAATSSNEAETGGDIELWNALTGEVAGRCVGHTDVVNDVATSPNGARLASGAGRPPPDTRDPSVRIWDLATAAQLRVLAGHTGGTLGVVFTADGSMVASGGRDAKVKIWNVSTGALTTTLPTHPSSVVDVALSPDGSMLASASGTRVWLWNTTNWSLIRTLPGSGWSIVKIEFSPDGQTLVVGLNKYGDNVEVWRVSDGSISATLPGDADGFITSVAYGRDGQTVISASGYTNRIRVWRIADEALLASYDQETSWGMFPVLSVALSPNGARLGYGRGDATLALARFPFDLAAGDLNCDGDVNTFDINPLVLALTDATGYASAFADCDARQADVNGDGAANGSDIDAFVTLLLSR
jgi:WD40 repeat protein